MCYCTVHGRLVQLPAYAGVCGACVGGWVSVYVCGCMLVCGWVSVGGCMHVCVCVCVCACVQSQGCGITGTSVCMHVCMCVLL